MCLLAVWLIPGLAGAETVFGFGPRDRLDRDGLLILDALRARVVTMRSAVAVAVLGGIGPFFGSYELRASRSTASNAPQRPRGRAALPTPVQSAR